MKLFVLTLAFNLSSLILVNGSSGDRLCTDAFCITVLLPDSQNALVLASISGNAGISWLGIGTGTQMAGSEMMILYQDERGPALQRRIGIGNVEPLPNSDGNLTSLVSAIESHASINPISTSASEALTSYASQIITTGITASIGNNQADTQLSSRDSDLILTYTVVRPQMTAQSIVNATATNFIYAVGSTVPTLNADQTVSLQKHNSYGTFTLDLSKDASGVLSQEPRLSTDNLFSLQGPSTPLSQHRIFLLVHGTLMIIAWALFNVSGVFVARFLRHWHGWFRTHWIIQTLTIATTIAGFAVALNLSQSSGYGHFQTPHQIVGLVFVAFVLIQGVLGVVTHSLKARFPRCNIVHILVGIGLFLTSPFQIWFQLTLYASMVVKIAIMIWFFITIGVYMILGALKYRRNRNARAEFVIEAGPIPRQGQGQGQTKEINFGYAIAPENREDAVRTEAEAASASIRANKSRWTQSTMASEAPMLSWFQRRQQKRKEVRAKVKAKVEAVFCRDSGDWG